MVILTFITTLMGSAMLLLFGVHFVRSGVERLWGPRIREWMDAERSRPSLLMVGASSAFVMQGGTAVVLIVAGLASAGTIPVLIAATVAIGAELGSALVLLALNFPISNLYPALLLVGCAMYLWSTSPRKRWAGRIVLGLGIVFLAMVLLKSVAAPVREFSGFGQIAAYLNTDIVASVLLGLVVTLAMHSSLAALLTAVAFVSASPFNTAFAVAFVIGANAGSALIPLWLLRASPAGQERAFLVAKLVAILRGGLLLGLLALLLATSTYSDWLANISPNHAMVGSHIVINILMLCMSPMLNLLHNECRRGDFSNEGGSFRTSEATLLPMQFRKHVQGMLDDLEGLLQAVFSDPPNLASVDQGRENLAQKLQAARADFMRLHGQNDRQVAEFDRQMDFAVRLERAGDILCSRLLPARTEGVQFSEEGHREICRLLEHVQNTVLMSQEVLASGNSDTARLLVKRKQTGADAEQTSRENHFRRIQSHNPTSFASSDTHLEIIASLKEVNSKLCSIAYAILDAEGALKKTRVRAPAKAQGGNK